MRHQKSKAHGGSTGRGKAPKRRTQIVVVPDGLGYLINTTSTPERLQTVSLQAVSRFAAALNDQRHFRSQKFSRREREQLKCLRDGAPGAVGDLDVKIPLVPDQALALYQIAQSANIPAKSVASLLVSYGLEHLATELRTQRTAPPPKSPTTIIRERSQPNTAHEEYLAENGLAVPQRKREYLEYHKRPIPGDELGAEANRAPPASVPPIHKPAAGVSRVDNGLSDPPKPCVVTSVPTEGVNPRRNFPRAQ